MLEKELCIARLVICYISSALVPIHAFLELEYNTTSFLSILLLSLDAIILLILIEDIRNKRYKTATVLFISVLPGIFFMLSMASDYSPNQVWRAVDLIRLTKLILLPYQYHKLMDSLKENASLSATTSRIALIGLFSVFYASTMACLWFGISCTLTADNSNCMDGNTWIESDVSSGIMQYSAVVSRYVRSLHFVTQTLFTVGYGDIHPVNISEVLFSLVLLLSGALFYGYVISCITSLLSSRDISTKLFRTDLGRLRQYLKLRKVEERVRDKFTAYFEYLFVRQLGLSEQNVLSMLPTQLRSELQSACCLTAFRNVPFFRNHPDGDRFINTCVSKLSMVTYGPGSLLSAAGSTERVMFLIRTGKVDILSPQTSKPLLSLITGDYFGDYHMIFGSPVEMEAVASGYTEVVTLSFDVLKELLSAQPAEEGEEEEFLPVLHAPHSTAATITTNVASGDRVQAFPLSRPLQRQRRVTSLILLENEITTFTYASGQKDSEQCASPQEGDHCERTSTHLEPGENAECTVNSLSRIRLKPLPARGREGLCKIAPIAETTQEDTVQVLQLPHQHGDSAGTPQEGGCSGNRGRRNGMGGRYHSSLCATFDAHQALQQRINKTLHAMEATSRTKRMAEMMEDQMVVSHTIAIPPGHIFRCCWEVILAIVVVFYNLAVPLRIMTQYNCNTASTAAECLSQWHWSLLIDYMGDAVLLIDFILRARYFAFRRYEGEKEVIETDSEAIWSAFQQSSRFALLLWLILPVDVLAPGSGYLLCLRIAKIPSGLLLPDIVQSIQAWLDHERGVSISAEAVTVTHLTLYTAFVTVWMTVGWCILHYNGAQSESWVSALYWCLTSITTTGYGDITPVDTRETAYNLGISVIGPTIFATIIAKFASYVKKVDVSTDNMEHRMTTTSQFVRTIFPDSSMSDAAEEGTLGFPFELDADMIVGSTKTGSASMKLDTSTKAAVRRLSGMGSSAVNLLRSVVTQSAGMVVHTAQHALRLTASTAKYRPSQSLSSRVGLETAVSDYFQYMDRGGRELLEASGLTPGAMAPHIEDELRAAVLENTITTLPMFTHCNKSFLQAIMRSLQQKLYSRRSVLLDSCVPEGWYLVKTGSVRVMDVATAQVQIKYAGHSFAEKALFSDINSVAIEAVAHADCEVWHLPRWEFERIVAAQSDTRELRRSIRTAVLRPIVLSTATAGSAAGGRRISTNNSISLSLTRPILNRLRRDNAVINEKQLQTATKHFQAPKKQEEYILKPDGKLGVAWMLLLTTFTVYNFLVLPLRIAFFQDCSLTWLYAIDYMGDLLFVTDIILRMYVFAYYERDELVVSRAKIYSNYRKSPRLGWDIASVLPFDLLALCAPLGTLGTAQVLSLFRLNRLIRLRDANAGLSMLESSFTSLLNTQSRSQKNALRLSKLIAVIFLIAHVFGCIFFLIANQLHLAGNYNNWADQASLFSDSTLPMIPTREEILTRYVASIYWAVALLTTVGYGDISPVSNWEKLYNIVLFVIGTLVYATVIVHLQDIVSELDVTSDLYKSRVQTLTGFLQREHVVGEYSDKARGYMERLWTAQRGAQSEEIQSFLPAALYSAAVSSAISQHLPQLFFVQKCHGAFQKAFLSQLQVSHYLKGDLLFRTGEAAQRLYFICQGEVSLVSIDLRTETVTAVDCQPDRRRSSVIGGIATAHARRSSIQESPFKAAGRGSDASSTQPSEPLRNRFSFTTLKRRSSTTAVPPAVGRRASVSGGNDRKKASRRTSYMRVHEGFVGETEFFHRNVYSCSAKVNTDAVLLEISFESFWKLVTQFQLQQHYSTQLHRGEESLQRNSTHTVVQKLDNNMANAKMAKMMTLCITEAPQLQCILPNSSIALTWDAVTLCLLVLQAICIPYFTAFPHSSSIVFHYSIDTIAAVVFAIDVYLRLTLFAVVRDGTLVTELADIYHHYAADHLQLDALATLPIALLVLAGTRHPVWYGGLRWLCLLRLRKASHLIDTALSTLSSLLGQPLRDGIKRVLIAIIAVLYIAHLSGCFFCVIGRIETKIGAASWLTENNFDSGTSFSIYLRSYYWAMYTLTTVGYGSLSVPTVPERLFAIAVMILGSILNAMLSALLSSLVESSDQSTGLVRRAAEATQKFCIANQIDASLQTRVSGYFQHLSDNLASSSDVEGFGLLSEALRSELILRTAWRSLRRVAYLDSRAYDKTAQQGFMLSLVRKMTVYVAVPGEVLASAPLSALLEDCNIAGTATDSAAALAERVTGGSSKKAALSKKVRRFYKDSDLIIARRGRVSASIVSAEKTTAATVVVEDDKQFVALGCVINLYSIATQLCDPTVTSGASRRSSIAFSRSSAVGVDESTTAVTQNKTGGLYGTQEVRRVRLVLHSLSTTTVRSAAPTSLRCVVRTGGQSVETESMQDIAHEVPGAGEYTFLLPSPISGPAEQTWNVEMEFFTVCGDNSTESALLGRSSLEVKRIPGLGGDQSCRQSGDSDVDSDSSDSSSDDDDLCTEAEEEDVSLLGFECSALQSTAQGPLQLPEESSVVSSESAAACTPLSEEGGEIHSTTAIEEGVDKAVVPRQSRRITRAASHLPRTASVHSEASAMVCDESGTVTGHVSIELVAVHGQLPQCDSTGRIIQQIDEQPRSAQSGAPDAQKQVVVVVAEEFSHLFRLPAAECRKLEDYYRLSRLPVEERLQHLV